MLTPAVLFALFLVFLGLTWTLSLAESAFSYLSRRDAEDIVREQPGSKALEIARERESHLGALRVWRFVAEALSAVCLTAAADAVVDDTWLAVAIAAVVLVGVAALLGVWSPRPIGSRNEAAVARRLGGLVWVLRRALGPLAARLDRDRRRREVEPEDEDDFQERHLREFVARAHDADVLADSEAELIQSVFSMNDTIVRSVMVPRTDVVTIDADHTLGQAMALFLRSGNSRIPVIGVPVQTKALAGVDSLYSILQMPRGYPVATMAIGAAGAKAIAVTLDGAPLAEGLMAFMPWQQVFLVFAALIMTVLMFLPMLRSTRPASRAELEESMGSVLRRAFTDPSYLMIFAGFFSCGYQLAFITAHFPAMVTEMCGPIAPDGSLAALGITSTSALGAVAISVIGLANIGGSILAGWLGKRYPRKYLLAGIYALRTLVAAWFILTPITPATVLIFSLAMGSLWLATVPLTSGLVAYIYGLRYMGTLYGFVFLSHQLGSFLGVWLGGKLYDIYGDYTIVWWVGVGVGAFSALIHLPVRELPAVLRPTAPANPA